MPILPIVEPPSTPGYVALSEAARIVGVHPETMRRRVRRGEIFGVRLGHASNCPILVPIAELDTRSEAAR
jgi:hypothetical protein